MVGEYVLIALMSPIGTKPFGLQSGGVGSVDTIAVNAVGY